LITLISSRCAQLSVQCSGLLTDTQSIRNGRLKWQVRGSYTGRCSRCVVYTDRSFHAVIGIECVHVN